MTVERRWWIAPLAIYLLTRVVAGVLMVLVTPHQTVMLEGIPGYHSVVPSQQPPGYLDVVTTWDAQWYWDITMNGYPASAEDSNGNPAQTALAFFPLYPTLVKAMMALSGLGFRVVAPTTSVLIGAAAVLVVHRLVEQCVDRRRALICVSLLCTFASAPVMQAAYTESLALLLVATALLLLHGRRYLLCLLPVVLLGLTRNIALALAPVVLLHWYWRIHEQEDSPRYMGAPAVRVPHMRIGLLGLATLAASAEWPVIVGFITADPRAYLTTMKAWPGFTGSVLRSPWAVLVSQHAAVLILLLLGLVGVLIGLRLLPGRRSWGPELWGWGIAYPIYVFAASSATLSFARYLLLAFPLGLLWVPDAESVQQKRRQAATVALLVMLGLVAQWFWVSRLLVFSGPSGGWGFP